MIGWLVRGALILGGIIAGWFVAPESHNFEVLSFIAALLIFTAAVALAAFGPALLKILRGLRR